MKLALYLYISKGLAISHHWSLCFVKVKGKAVNLAEVRVELFKLNRFRMVDVDHFEDCANVIVC